MLTAALVVVGLALMGMPLFACLAGLGLVGLYVAGAEGVPLADRLAAGIEDVGQLTGDKAVSLSTIPLFTFAGYLMAGAKTAQRLVRAGNPVLGWIPGGLAVLTLWTCAFFTTFTGASGVTIVAIGGLMLPVLEHANYSKKHALGIVTGSGSVGLLFPPSLPLVVYGIIFGLQRGQAGLSGGAEFSVEKFFLYAGIVPGLVLLTILSAYCIYEGWRSNTPRQPFAPWKLAAVTMPAVVALVAFAAGTDRLFAFFEQAKPAVKGLVALAGTGAALSGVLWGLATDREFRAAIWEAKWELAIPLVVIGPVATGLAQLPEAAALCAAYVLAIEVVVYKDISLRRDILKLTRESMTLVGAIFVKILGATLLTAYFIIAEIPTHLFEWMSTWVHSASVFLLVMNIALLLVGCLMDIFSAIIVVVPLIAPAAAQFNIDPYHLGVIFLLNLEIGYLLPPAGLNLFIAAFRFNRPITEIYRSVVAFIGLMFVALMIVTYVPGLTVVPGHKTTAGGTAPAAAATDSADPLGDPPAAPDGGYVDPLADIPIPTEDGGAADASPDGGVR